MKIRNKKNKLLCVVDMQNSFINERGVLYIKSAKYLVEKFDSFIENLQPEAFQAVLLTQDTHFQEEYSNNEESKKFPLHCEYNTQDWQFAINVDAIKNKFTTYRMYKNSLDMWQNYNNYEIDYSSNDIIYSQLFKIVNINKGDSYFLRDILKLFPPQTTNIYLCGVAADYCVQFSLNGFLAHNYQVNLITSLIRGIDKEITTVTQDYIYRDFIKNNKIKLINSNYVK